MSGTSATPVSCPSGSPRHGPSRAMGNLRAVEILIVNSPSRRFGVSSRTVQARTVIFRIAPGQHGPGNFLTICGCAENVIHHVALVSSLGSLFQPFEPSIDLRLYCSDACAGAPAVQQPALELRKVSRVLRLRNPAHVQGKERVTRRFAPCHAVFSMPLNTRESLRIHLTRPISRPFNRSSLHRCAISRSSVPYASGR